MSGKVTLGNYGRTDVRAAVNLPLVEGKVNARLAGFSLNNDGFYNSAVTANSSSRDIGKDDKLTLRPSIQFILSDSMDLTFIGEWHQDKSHVRPAKKLLRAEPLAVQQPRLLRHTLRRGQQARRFRC